MIGRSPVWTSWLIKIVTGLLILRFFFPPHIRISYKRLGAVSIVNASLFYLCHFLYFHIGSSRVSKQLLHLYCHILLYFYYIILSYIVLLFTSWGSEEMICTFFSIVEECYDFTLQVFTTQSQYPDCSGYVVVNPSTPPRVLSLTFNFLIEVLSLTYSLS